MARRFGMTHRHQRNNAAGGAKEQRQPQGAHFANVGNGKARNIAAEHADTHRVDRPEPAQRGAGTVAADVVDNGDDKGVEEQRVGQAADAIKQQDQRIVGATEAEDEEQYVEYTPQHEANQHSFTWGNDFRHHAGDPRRQGGSQTVESKGKGSLRRGESECFDVVRQKSQLKAVAGHKHGDGDISPDEVER